MSEMPEYTEHEIRERNIRQFAADMRERTHPEVLRLRQENQHLREFICKLLGRPFVEMADETKEVWR